MAQVDATRLLLSESDDDLESRADELEVAATRLHDIAGEDFASADQRLCLAEAWRIAGFMLRYDAAIRKADQSAATFLTASQRNAEVLLDRISASTPTQPAILAFLRLAKAASTPGDATKVCAAAGRLTAPMRIVDELGTARRRHGPDSSSPEPSAEKEGSFAVCVATLLGSPITDVLVVRPSEVYAIGVSLGSHSGRIGLRHA